jgi:hypothetical protein
MHQNSALAITVAVVIVTTSCVGDDSKTKAENGFRCDVATDVQARAIGFGGVEVATTARSALEVGRDGNVHHVATLAYGVTDRRQLARYLATTPLGPLGPQVEAAVEVGATGSAAFRYELAARADVDRHLKNVVPPSGGASSSSGCAQRSPDRCGVVCSTWWRCAAGQLSRSPRRSPSRRTVGTPSTEGRGWRRHPRAFLAGKGAGHPRGLDAGHRLRAAVQCAPPAGATPAGGRTPARVPTGQAATGFVRPVPGSR